MPSPPLQGFVSPTLAPLFIFRFFCRVADILQGCRHDSTVVDVRAQINRGMICDRLCRDGQRKRGGTPPVYSKTRYEGTSLFSCFPAEIPLTVADQRKTRANAAPEVEQQDVLPQAICGRSIAHPKGSNNDGSLHRLVCLLPSSTWFLKG